MTSDNRNLLRLIAWRQQVMESDVIWNEQNGENAFNELLQVQSRILECDLNSERSFVLAARLLLSGNDDPNFADDFKNSLFDKLRRFSEGAGDR